MNRHEFVDALADSVITLDGASFDSHSIQGDGAAKRCTSLFFPGCSFTNYAQEILTPLYQRLVDEGIADGISLVCCGKILKFEENAEEVKPAFQADLKERLLAGGIKRIVAACPNCVKEFRSLLDEEDGIEVVVLPRALADAGIRLDEEQIRGILACDSREKGTVPFSRPCLSIHDSCPDRDYGQFADAARELFDPSLLVEMKSNRKRSICCGALLNAMGRHEAALKQAERRGEQAVEVQAQAIVTYCMSCVNLLSHWQKDVPVHHYLEFLVGECIDWQTKKPYLEMRFLFEELQGTRSFNGASAAT